MPYYRIHCNLAFKDKTLPIGTIARLSLSDKIIQTHLQFGNISRVSTPPMDILPGWEDRTAKLRPLEIHTIEDFLEAIDDDMDAIARLFEVEAADVLQWRQELVRDWLTV